MARVKRIMESEANPAEEQDDIPAFWPLDYVFSAKDALALVSFLIFAIAPMGLGLYAVGAWFGILNNIPVKDQIHGSHEWLLLVVTVAAVSMSVIIGKYCWLFAMCRILNRANIGPLIAYGMPRRIGGLDRLLVKRLYRSPGLRLEDRMRPPKTTGYLVRLQGIAFGVGSLLSAALSFLPLMRGDHRLWSFTVFFGVLALLYLVLAHYSDRKRL